MADEAVATDESGFWDRRHDLTISPITNQDLEERGAGRDRHLVLLAHLDDVELINSIRPHLNHLGDFDCVEPIPDQNLHVTVKVFGNVVQDPTSETEFSRSEEREIAVALDPVLSEFTSFEVEFIQYNLFPGTVYAEVADDGRFRAMNRRVCEISNVPVFERDRDGFIPHLTMGHFIHRSGYEQLIDYLESNRRLELPVTRIEQVELVALDLSEGRFPPYETIQAYPFD